MPSQKRWDIPYHKAFFKTSHNSFSHSIKKQLNTGVRGLEYDIHDDKIQELNDFEVYHLQDKFHVALDIDGNPNDFLFSNWLKILKNWSDEHDNEHAPITLFIELKDSIVDANNQPDNQYGIKRFNQIIIDSLTNDKLYTYKEFRKNNFKWPKVKELKGLIIVVITSYWGGYWASSEGGFESRLQYLRNSLDNKEDICFVAWIEEDKGNQVQFLKDKTNFWKCSLELSTKYHQQIENSQRLTRADFDKIRWGRHIKTYYKKDYNAGYRCNFPVTDSWGDQKYDESFPWSI
ncbi:MAG: Ca2+-dependent phosphoinositide-specific phospholipase C [Candidatus Hodarchaeota archaeon]